MASEINRRINFLQKIKRWIPFALVITALCGLVYLVGQQNLRQGANDPQIQMAEDIAAKLSTGKSPSEVIPSEQTDISNSLNTFVTIYDQNKNPVASSANLDGLIPELPAGVFNFVSDHGEDRITWQPKPEVRIAAVITKYNNNNLGYVLVGRSLREVEKRESQLMFQVEVAGGAILLASLVAVIIL